MPSIALPVSLRGQLLSGSRFSPLSLFAASEPGVWYDPSDLTTMFQDTAGTTPVTTPGQTVARINDKSGRGNNATQATTASRPTYGIVPLGGRRNLLTFSEDLSNAVWQKNNVTATSGIADPVGGMAAWTLAGNGSSGFLRGLQTSPVGVTVRVSVYLKAGTATTAVIGDVNLAAIGSFNLSSGSVISGATSQITPAGDGWYRCRVSYTTISSGAFTINPGSSFSAATTSSVLVWGAQLETGSTATAYQRVTTQYDVTESGVQSLSYLAFDGVDDTLSCGTFAVSENWHMTAGVIVNSRNGIGVKLWGTKDLTGQPDCIGLYTRTDVVEDLVAGLRVGGGTSFTSSIRGQYAILSNFIAEGYHQSDTISVRVNGGTVVSSSANDNLTSSASLSLGGIPSINFFGGVFIKRALTVGEQTELRNYVNGKTGAYA